MKLKDNLELKRALESLVYIGESIRCDCLHHEKGDQHDYDQLCPAEDKVDFWTQQVEKFITETWGNK